MIGSIFTTLDPTFGGGLKLFLPTCPTHKTKNNNLKMLRPFIKYLHQVTNSCKQLHIGGQTTVELVPWLGNKPLCKLPLEHDDSTPRGREAAHPNEGVQGVNRE